MNSNVVTFNGGIAIIDKYPIRLELFGDPSTRRRVVGRPFVAYEDVG